MSDRDDTRDTRDNTRESGSTFDLIFARLVTLRAGTHTRGAPTRLAIHSALSRQQFTPRRVATITMYDSVERGAADECKPLTERRADEFGDDKTSSSFRQVSSDHERPGVKSGGSISTSHTLQPTQRYGYLWSLECDCKPQEEDF